MNERVVSLSDRGRALEWLSLGFGLWLIAGLVFSLLVADGVTPTLAMISGAAHLIAGAAITVGAGLLLRTGSRVWPTVTLAALAVILVERTLILWLPFHHLSWTIGAASQLVMLGSAAYGLRDIASREGRPLPLLLVGAVVAADAARFLLLATHGSFGDPLLPWARAGLVGVVSTVSVGLVLLAIREASAVVRAQIFAGEPGVTSPARAADWQRTARGLDRFGALVIAKVALDAAAVPIFICSVLIGLGGFFTVQLVLVPLAGAVFSAGMVMALLAARTVPDPPDARAGFSGAALLIAACLAGDVYLATTRAWQPLLEALSALGHLVAYLAVLRSIGRIGERLGDDELTRRARILGWVAALAVGSATAAGFLLRRGVPDLAIEIAVPIAVAGVSFAALLPCALLARELATRLRDRFAAPPTARVASRHSR
jgi:hypothetical protein